MGDKLFTLATGIVTAVAVVATVTHPRFVSTVRGVGGVFVGSLRQIVAAGGR